MFWYFGFPLQNFGYITGSDALLRVSVFSFCYVVLSITIREKLLDHV